MLQFVARHLICQRRTRPYQAHVAPENVEQLWQLIQAELAQNPAKRRYARIVLYLEENAVPLVRRRERSLHAVSACLHRSELPQPEDSALSADPVRHIKRRSGRIQLD